MPLSRVISTGIQDGTIVTTDLADNAVNSAKIGVDVIVADDLAANSVTVSEIADGAVTGAKLANNLNYDSGTLYLDSTNNRVGIGTNSPSGKFHVLSNSDVRIAGTGNSHYTYFYSNNTTAKGSIASLSSSLRVQAQSSGDLELFNTSNSGIIVKNNGNVGIGSTSALEKLRVSGNFELYNDDTDGYIWFHDAGTRSWSVGSDQSTGNFAITNVQGLASGNQRLVISQSGNVGISNTTADSFFAGATNLVVGSGSGNQGMTIFSGTSSIGNIKFADGTGSDAAKTAGGIRYDHSSNFMRFDTNDGSERMRISSNGAVGINSNSTSTMLYINSSTAVNAGNAGLTNFVDQTNRVSNYRYHNASSFSSYIYLLYTNRSQNSAYNFMNMGSGGAADVEFSFRGDGQAFADGSFNGGGADYAEYFEWVDGNTTNEDRRGYTVVLDGNMIRKATDEDDASQIIGAVSATPCVIGDHADNKWSDKYLKDDFGNYLYDEHNAVEWTEIITDEEGNETEKRHSYEDWRLPVGIEVPDDATVLTHDVKGNRLKHRRLNPDFDSDVEYITRENRPEWTPIGMMGKLRIRKGQPMGDRWIKMRDVSETVEEWLVR